GRSALPQRTGAREDRHVSARHLKRTAAHALRTDALVRRKLARTSARPERSRYCQACSAATGLAPKRQLLNTYSARQRSASAAGERVAPARESSHASVPSAPVTPWSVTQVS